MLCRNFFLFAIIVSISAVQWLTLVDANDVCMWCEPGLAERFMDCLTTRITSDPVFAGLQRNTMSDMRDSLQVISSIMAKTPGATKMQIMNEALAGELAGRITQIGQNSEVATSEMTTFLGGCYYSTTGQSEVSFANNVGKVIQDIVRDNREKGHTGQIFVQNQNPNPNSMGSFSEANQPQAQFPFSPSQQALNQNPVPTPPSINGFLDQSTFGSPQRTNDAKLNAVPPPPLINDNSGSKPTYGINAPTPVFPLNNELSYQVAPQKPVPKTIPQAAPPKQNLPQIPSQNTSINNGLPGQSKFVQQSYNAQVIPGSLPFPDQSSFVASQTLIPAPIPSPPLVNNNYNGVPIPVSQPQLYGEKIAPPFSSNNGASNQLSTGIQNQLPEAIPLKAPPSTFPMQKYADVPIQPPDINNGFSKQSTFGSSNQARKYPGPTPNKYDVHPIREVSDQSTFILPQRINGKLPEAIPPPPLASNAYNDETISAPQPPLYETNPTYSISPLNNRYSGQSTNVPQFPINGFLDQSANIPQPSLNNGFSGQLANVPQPPLNNGFSDQTAKVPQVPLNNGLSNQSGNVLQVPLNNGFPSQSANIPPAVTLNQRDYINPMNTKYDNIAPATNFNKETSGNAIRQNDYFSMPSNSVSAVNAERITQNDHGNFPKIPYKHISNNSPPEPPLYFFKSATNNRKESVEDCALKFSEALSVELMKNDAFRSVFGTTTMPVVAKYAASGAIRRAFVHNQLGAYARDASKIFSVQITTGSLPAGSDSQAYAKNVAKSAMDVLYKNNLLTENCEAVARSIASSFTSWLETFYASYEEKLSEDSNMAPPNAVPSDSFPNKGASNTNVQSIQSSTRLPSQAGKFVIEDEDCDDDETDSSKQNNQSDTAKNEFDDCEDDMPDQDDIRDQEEDCEDGEKSTDSVSNAGMPKKTENKKVNKNRGSPLEYMGHLQKLIESAHNSISPKGFDFDHFTATMLDISGDMQDKHPGWRTNKIYSKTALETIVALTLVIQDLANPKPNN